MSSETSFPTKKMKIKLKQATPSQLTVQRLQEQLNGIGLGCKHTSQENLTKYKKEVLEMLDSTRLQACGISKPSNRFSEAAFLAGHLGNSDEPYIDGALKLENAATGEWEFDISAAGYQLWLSSVQVPAHFDYLQKNRPSFSGQTVGKEKKEDLTSVDAIKNLFVETASAASDTFGKKINKVSVEAFYSNALSEVSEGKDYDQWDSRILFLTLDHDPVKGECSGVAVINLSWHIYIKNYKRKDKDGGNYHSTSISVTSRGVFYSDPDVLEGDYNAVKAAFKTAKCLLFYPKEPVPVTVFPARPEANKEAFISGIPSKMTKDYTDSIILHTPHTLSEEARENLCIGQEFQLNNVELPDSEITYSIQTDVSQNELSMPVYANVSCRMLDQNASLSQFKPGSIIHQAVIKADVLRHNVSDGSYEYIESGIFKTGTIKAV